MNYTYCKLVADSISEVAIVSELPTNPIVGDSIRNYVNVIVNNIATPQQDTTIWNYISPLLGVIVGFVLTSVFHSYKENKGTNRKNKNNFIDSILEYSSGSCTSTKVKVSYSRLAKDLQKKVNLEELLALNNPNERKKYCESIINNFFK